MRDSNSKVQTDNGWFYIRDHTPNDGEEVTVVFERESSLGVTYDFIIRDAEYVHRDPYGHFLGENGVWNVRYWRRKDKLPLPNGVVIKEVEECRKQNLSFRQFIDYQHECGVDVRLD